MAGADEVPKEADGAPVGAAIPLLRVDDDNEHDCNRILHYFECKTNPSHLSFVENSATNKPHGQGGGHTNDQAKDVERNEQRSGHGQRFMRLPLLLGLLHAQQRGRNVWFFS